jgi:TfoX/Sxy family transcriptional regulator of competence genes
VASKKSPVSKWKPASDEWVRAFDAALPADAERRKMFGYPAAFVNGNMACGLHHHGLVLRLGEDDRVELMKAGGAPFEPMPGRIMTGFMVAPQKFATKKAELKRWLDRSFAYAATLPKKAKKKKK